MDTTKQEIIEQNAIAAKANIATDAAKAAALEPLPGVKTLQECHVEMRELLGNALYIFKKTEHFAADEIDAMAKWLVDRIDARAGVK